MRIRFEATTRSPASSIILMMPPVRLRRVASGLIIEKVRVAAMTGRSPVMRGGFVSAPSGERPMRQDSALAQPFAVLPRPIAALDAFPARKQLPGEACAFEGGVVKQVEA